jgi:hypothetical protein
MEVRSTFTGKQLAGALQALGIQFIMGEISADKNLHIHLVSLIAALAESNDEARLRLSIIPLFWNILNLLHTFVGLRIRSILPDGLCCSVTTPLQFGCSVSIGRALTC